MCRYLVTLYRALARPLSREITLPPTVPLHVCRYLVTLYRAMVDAVMAAIQLYTDTGSLTQVSIVMYVIPVKACMQLPLHSCRNQAVVLSFDVLLLCGLLMSNCSCAVVLMSYNCAVVSMSYNCAAVWSFDITVQSYRADLLTPYNSAGVLSFDVITVRACCPLMS